MTLGKHRTGQRPAPPKGGRAADRRPGRQAEPRPVRGRPEASSVLRETLLWGVFACLLVPVFLIWSGTPVGTALLTTGGLLALGVVSYLVVQASGIAAPDREPGSGPEAGPEAESESEAAPYARAERPEPPSIPALEPALEPAAVLEPEPAHRWAVEAGWLDEQPVDGQAAAPGSFAFPLYRDQKPERYRWTAGGGAGGS